MHQLITHLASGAGNHGTNFKNFPDSIHYIIILIVMTSLKSESAHIAGLSHFTRRISVKITEVRISLKNEGKLRAFASITLDCCFVVRGLKVINGSRGFFVSMPSRRRRDGGYQDIAHPINSEMRQEIEDKVLDAFENELNRMGQLSSENAFMPQIPAGVIEEEEFVLGENEFPQ